MNKQVDEIMLTEEIFEKQAYDAFNEKVTAEYNLRMELARAIAYNDVVSASKISVGLPSANAEIERVTEIYYKARVASAKARRDLVEKTERLTHPFELYEIIMPIYDKEVWETEYQLASFLQRKRDRIDHQ